MKIFFAGNPGYFTYDIEAEFSIMFRLQSFAYDKREEFAKKQNLFKDTMLDSGAYTYAMAQNAVDKNIDWKEYIDNYIRYINKYNIGKFFELDIDNIVGEKNVRRITKYIERKVGRQPIPVWHLSRGKQNFIDMCKNYPYVAIGGIVAKEISLAQQKYFPWFVKTAHSYGAQIHALGLSNVTRAIDYGFDSVDVTRWLDGRFGNLCYFDGRVMRKIKKGDNMRAISFKQMLYHQTKEWVKYQKYVYENTAEFGKEKKL